MAIFTKTGVYGEMERKMLNPLKYIVGRYAQPSFLAYWYCEVHCTWRRHLTVSLISVKERQIGKITNVNVNCGISEERRRLWQSLF